MASRFWVGGTGTWDASDTTHWASTSGGAGGQSVPGSGDTVTFNGSSGGGTVTLGANTNVISITAGAFTGTLNANGFNVQVQTLSLSGTGTRTITMGAGTWTVTSNNATIIDIGTTTNLTFNRGNSFVCNYSGSTGTRTINLGSLAQANAPGVSITAGTDTVAISTNVFDLNFTGFSGTFTNVARTVYGSVTFSSGMTLSTGTNATTFGATSGTKTITSNGKTIDFPITYNGAGSTIQLSDAMVVGSTRTFTLTAGTFDTNNQNFSCGLFSSNNSNTRVLTMGSGTFRITGNAGTVWTTSTVTGFTLNNRATVDFNYSGATGTRTITLGSFSAANAIRVAISAGTDTISMTGVCEDLTFTGFSGSWTNNTLSIVGSLIVSTGMTVSAGSNTVSFTFTSGTETVTSNGKTLDFPVTVNIPAATLQLVDAFVLGSSRTFTFTAGTLDTNGQNFTAGIWSSNNSNTRNLTMGAGTFTITGNAATVWNMLVATNFTYTNRKAIIFNYSGSTGTRTLSPGAATGANAMIANITAGTDTVTIITGADMQDLSFAGFAGTWTANQVDIFGNLTLGSGMTTSGSGDITIRSDCDLTTNGVNVDRPMTVNGTATTLELQDNLLMGSSRTLNVTLGTLSANDNDITVGRFQSTSAASTRVLNMGSGTWELTGTDLDDNLWNVNGSGSPSTLTINADTSTILISGSTANNRNFVGGVLPNQLFTYYNLEITNATANGTFSIGAGSTFHEIRQEDVTAQTLRFNGTTTTELFNCNGTSGNLLTITSGDNSSTFNLVKTGGGTVSCDYLDIQHSIARPWSGSGGGNDTWYAGNNSNDNQSDPDAGDGWLFSDPPAPPTYAHISRFPRGAA